MIDKAQGEHYESASHPIADMRADIAFRRSGPKICHFTAARQECHIHRDDALRQPAACAMSKHVAMLNSSGSAVAQI
jgi:hypothetical protein